MRFAQNAMTENMQARCVQSRKAFFVRCCLKLNMMSAGNAPEKNTSGTDAEMPNGLPQNTDAQAPTFPQDGNGQAPGFPQDGNG